MKCLIHSNNIDVSTQFRSQIKDKINRTFERVREKVHTVVVSFQDINGQRGGVDKQCKIMVVGDGYADVYVVESQPTAAAAFNHGIARAHRTLINRIKKLVVQFRKSRTSSDIARLDLLADN